MIRFVNVVAFGAQLDEGLYNSDSRTALNKQNFVGGGGSYGKALELACHAIRINVVVAQWPNWHFRSIFHTVSHWGKKPQLFIHKFPGNWCLRNVNFDKYEIFKKVNFVKNAAFEYVNFVKYEIFKMWILWKLLFPKYEFLDKWGFLPQCSVWLCVFYFSWIFRKILVHWRQYHRVFLLLTRYR